MKLIPKNWDKFQQYKDRKPTWIKLHRDLLNDFSYSSVQIGTKATLPLLWLLACEYDYGEIDASIEEISFRIHIDLKTVKVAIDELVKHNFFTLIQDDTEVYKMVPREEKRRDREETKKEIYIVESEETNNLFIEYLAIRKKLKLSNSSTVVTRLLNKIYKFVENGHNANEVILNAITGNWKDFYEPKKQAISFQEQERQKTRQIGDAVMNGFDPFDPANYESSSQGVIDAEIQS